MIRRLTAILTIILAIYISPINACVGKTLHIGIIDSPNEQLLAELASQLITERTGTTVKIETFKGQKELYNSVKKGQVGLIIENTDHAMEMIGKPRAASGKAAFETVKAEYRKSLNLIWLEPFGTIQGGGTQLYAPVISNEILGSLPALPKLLQKLSGITSDSGYQRLLKAKGDNPKKIAKDFLKSKN